MNNLNINKYKKRNYIQMLSESNKLLLGKSQNVSRNRIEIDLNKSKSENINILGSSEIININSNTNEKRKKL